MSAPGTAVLTPTMQVYTAKSIGGRVPNTSTPIIEIGCQSECHRVSVISPQPSGSNVNATSRMPSSAAVRPARSGKLRSSGIPRV